MRSDHSSDNIYWEWLREGLAEGRGRRPGKRGCFREAPPDGFAPSSIQPTWRTKNGGASFCFSASELL